MLKSAASIFQLGQHFFLTLKQNFEKNNKVEEKPRYGD